MNISNRGLIIADPRTGVTNIPGIFSGGDVIAGPRTVVEAVASGKEAAISIDQYLRGVDPDARCRRDWKGIEYIPETAEKRVRKAMQRLSLFERQRTFEEIDLGFNEEDARCEAGRCFGICGMQRTEMM
jgi:NADPH-dependent glutamate synthase beta subunit-like oxidoreductase